MSYDWSSLSNIPKVDSNVETEYKFSPYKKSAEYGVEADRSIVDRVFDALSIGNYATASAIYNATDNDKNTSVVRGLLEGIKAGNPLGAGEAEGEHTYSDVLGNLGANPESTGGNIAKGAVSFGLDVLADPLTYINPFGAAAKVVQGSGKSVKNMLTLEQAAKVIKDIYKKKGQEFNPLIHQAEVEDLYNKFNGKVLKIKEGGEDFNIGIKNLPFSNKFSDKTLNSFNRTIMSADKLRSIGDKTISPYYHDLTEKLKTQTALKHIIKNSDLIELAKTNPEEAAMKYKLERMHKGFSPSSIDKDIKSMNTANKASAMWDELNPNEQDEFVKWYEKKNGGYKDWKLGKTVLAEKVDKVKGNTNASEQLKETTKNIEESIKRSQEATDEIDVDALHKDTAKGRMDGKITDFVTNFDEANGLATAEDDIFDNDLKSKLYDDEITSILKSNGLIEDYQKPANKVDDYTGESADVYDNDSQFFSDLKKGSSYKPSVDIEPFREQFNRGGDLRQELWNKIRFQYPNKGVGEGSMRLFSDESKETLAKDINSKLFDGKEVVTKDMSDDIFNKMHNAIKNKDSNAFRKSLSDIYFVKKSGGVNDNILWTKALEKAQGNLNPEWFKRFDNETNTPIAKIDFPRNNVYYSKDGTKDGEKVIVKLSELPNIAKDYSKYKEFGGQSGINEKINSLNNRLKSLQGNVDNKLWFDEDNRLKIIRETRQINMQLNGLENLKTITNKQHMLNESVKHLGLKNIEELANVNPKLLEGYADMINQNRLNMYNNVMGTKKGSKYGESYNANRDGFIDKIQGERTGTVNNDYAGTMDIADEFKNELGVEEDKYYKTQRELEKEETSHLFGSDSKAIKHKFENPEDNLAYYLGRLDKSLWGKDLDAAAKIKVNNLNKAMKTGNSDFIPKVYKEQLESMPPEEVNKLESKYRNKKENDMIKDLNKLDYQSIKDLIKGEPDADAQKWYQQYLDRRFPMTRPATNFANKAILGAENIMEHTPSVEKIDPEMPSKIVKTFAADSPETAESVEEISDVLRSSDQNERFIKLANYISEHMNQIAEEEVRTGRLSEGQADEWRNKYLYHMQTDAAKKWSLEQLSKDFNGKFNPSTFAVGYEKRFNQGRIFDTIEEANKVMKEKTGVDKWFEDDVIKILQARSLLHNRLLYNDEMVGAVRRIAGTDYVQGKPVENATPVASFVDLNNKLLQRFDGVVPDKVLEYLDIDKRFYSPNNAYIPLRDDQIEKIRRTVDGANTGIEPVDFFNLDNQMMARLNKESAIQKRMHQHDLLNIYDKYLTMWKLWNTTVNPGFHVQNAVSNSFQSFMSDGASVLEPKRYKQAYDIYSGKNPTKKVKIGSYDLTQEQYKLLAQKYGILDNTFFNEDIKHISDRPGILHNTKISPKLDPTDINNFAPYNVGAKEGSKIEGTQRLVLFFKGLEDGKSIEDSVDNVNKFLFDYSDLTDAEKNVMKRVIPFYTFMSKNIPLQLEQLLENPFLYNTTNKAINNIEEMSGDNRVEDSQRNPFRKDYIQMPFQIGGENFGINPQLPYQQLDRLTPRKILGQSTPVVKTPLEALSGEYIYTGIPIESPLNYLSNQVQYSKMFDQSANKEGLERKLYILGQLFGLPSGTLQAKAEQPYTLSDF